MKIDDYYMQLFGKTHIQDGNVIDFSEHGRIGGVSTGQGVKYVQILDNSGVPIVSFGGGTQYLIGATGATLTGNLTLWRDGTNTLRAASSSLPFPVEIKGGGVLSTLSTLPVVAGQVGTWSFRPDSYVTDDSAMPSTPFALPVAAEYRASATTYADGDATVLQSDVNGNLKVTLGTTIAGEDTTNNRMMVEHQYQYSRKTADGQVKGSAGFIHTVTFSATGVVTAGTITIYDNTAESGTIIWGGIIQTGLNPTTIIIDAVCGTGIYVGYDGTVANVATTVSYR